MKNIIYFLRPFLKNHIRLISIVFLICFLANVVTLILPIYIAQSFDLLFDISSHRAQILYLIPFLVQKEITAYLIVFSALLLLKGILDFSCKYLMALLGEKQLHFFRKKIFTHQLAIKMETYEEKGIGKYLLRYSGDLNSIQSLLTKGGLQFICDVLIITLAIFILYQISPVLAQSIFAVLLVLTIVLFILNKKLHQASLKRRNAKSGLLKFVSHRLQAILTVKSFNREVIEANRFNKKTDRLLELGKNYQRIHSGISAIIPAGLYLMLGVMMLVFINLKKYSPGEIQADQYFAAILLTITLLPVFRRCFRVNILWRNASISFKKLIHIFELEKEKQDQQEALQKISGALNIINLSFRFPNKHLLFENLNIKIPGNGIYTIHGKGGTGKSSLVKLLNGSYLPGSGFIFLDDLDYQELSRKILRKYISVVSDHFHLLGNTVFEAISYSRKKEKRPVANNMLSKLGLSRELSLDTRIGELGQNLSFQQKKLLQYSRAFLTRKPILIIDQGFDNLDKAAMKNICQYLHQIKHKTTIIILDQKTNFEDLEIDQSFDLIACQSTSKNSLLGINN